MWLTSCARTQSVFVQQTVPANLTKLCIPPNPPTNMTWGDSVEYNETLLHLLEVCNADKRAIRKILSTPN
ncbi:Rz1-like lysis system protein LysC [Zophobihabitans entericus]